MIHISLCKRTSILAILAIIGLLSRGSRPVYPRAQVSIVLRVSSLSDQRRMCGRGGLLLVLEGMTSIFILNKRSFRRARVLGATPMEISWLIGQRLVYRCGNHPEASRRVPSLLGWNGSCAIQSWRWHGHLVRGRLRLAYPARLGIVDLPCGRRLASLGSGGLYSSPGIPWLVVQVSIWK